MTRKIKVEKRDKKYLGRRSVVRLNGSNYVAMPKTWKDIKFADVYIVDEETVLVKKVKER
jgi:hypothetical protein